MYCIPCYLKLYVQGLIRYIKLLFLWFEQQKLHGQATAFNVETREVPDSINGFNSDNRLSRNVIRIPVRLGVLNIHSITLNKNVFMSKHNYVLHVITICK